MNQNQTQNQNKNSFIVQVKNIHDKKKKEENNVTTGLETKFTHAG